MISKGLEDRTLHEGITKDLISCILKYEDKKIFKLLKADYFTHGNL